MPVVPETKFFAVDASLKSVFNSTQQPFSLFGNSIGTSDLPGDDDDDNDDAIDSVADPDDTKVTGKLLQQINVCCWN